MSYIFEFDAVPFDDNTDAGGEAYAIQMCSSIYAELQQHGYALIDSIDASNHAKLFVGNHTSIGTFYSSGSYVMISVGLKAHGHVLNQQLSVFYTSASRFMVGAKMAASLGLMCHKDIIASVADKCSNTQLYYYMPNFNVTISGHDVEVVGNVNSNDYWTLTS